MIEPIPFVGMIEIEDEPVAWMTTIYRDDNLLGRVKIPQFHQTKPPSHFYDEIIPLYTHTAKHLSLQKVDGELVAVTYTDDEHRIIEVLWEKPPAKTLTDEEIDDVLYSMDWAHDPVEFAKAILRKAKAK